MPDETIQNLNIDISVDDNASSQVKSLEESIDSLLKKFETLDTKSDSVSKSLGDFGNTGKSLDNVASKIDKTAKSAEKLAKTDMSSNVKKQVSEVQQSVSKLDKTKINTPDIKVDTKEIKNVSNAMASAEQATKRFGKTSSNIKPVNTEITNIGNNSKKSFKSLGKISKQLKQIDKGAKKSTKSTKKFSNGLRNILWTAKQFLIFGAFFTIQRQISDAFGEGTQNLYQYSKVLGGDFANSMDRITTSFLYLKNSIGAAVAPIINYFTPALESLTDTIANFVNKLAELFAALSGQTTFKKAIKSFTEYAEAVDTATKSNNNALASFDEINNITTSTNEGTDELNKNPSTMFETAQVGQGLNLDSEKFALITSIFENLKRVWDECKETLENLQPILDILLWDWAAPLVDLGLEALAAAWDKLNEALRAFSNWCAENPETVKTMADIILALFVGIETYLLVKKIGEKLVTFGKNLVDWAKNADKAKLAASGLAIAGFAILSSEILKISKNWSSMNKTEKIIAVLGGLAIAAAAAAAAVGALQSAWSLGIAAAAIVAGIIAIEASISSAQKRAEKNAKIDTKSAFADGGFPTTGQMFIARESGPELVGSIGGRTAVVNNDQIVQAVSMGVYNAVVDAFSTTSDNGNEQPVVVQIDGREVFRAVRSQNDSFRRRTGTSAF